MIDILYGDNAFTLRFEVPSEWATPTGVNLVVTRDNGTAVLTSTATTLGFTATTLSSATSRGDKTFATAASLGAAPGDFIRIAAGASGPAEDCEIDFYAVATKTATLTMELNHAHASGAAVSPLWATYALDVSDTDDYPLHGRFVLEWTSNSSDERPVTQYARIVKRVFRVLGFKKQFARRYRDLYDVIRKRWSAFEADTYDELQTRYAGDGFDLDRCIDADRMTEVCREALRWIVVDSTGDRWADDREAAMVSYNTAYQRTLTAPIWRDIDEDLNKDDGEDSIPTTVYSSRNY